MNKKKKMGIALVTLGFFLIISGCISSRYSTKLKNKDNKDYKITFKDISFIKEKYLSRLKILNDEYLADKESLYSIEGKVLFDIKDYYYIGYYSNLFILEKNNYYEVFDNKFNKVFEDKFDDIYIESDNCLFLYKEIFEKPILYNPNTKKQYKGYDDAVYVNDNFILLLKRSSDGKEMYLLDIVKDEIKKTDAFDNLWLHNISSYQNKYLIAEKQKNSFSGSTGIFDINGKEVLEAKYKNIELIFDDYLFVENEKSYYIMKGINKNVIDIQKKDDLKLSVNDIYLVGNLVRIELSKNDNEYYEVYDLNKNLIYSSSDNVYISELSDNKSIIIDEKNKICKAVISNGKKTETKNLDYSKCGYSDKNGYIAVELSDKLQVLDSDFKVIFEGDYKYIDLEETYFIVEDRSGKIKIFSYDGKQLIDKTFDDYEPDFSNGGVFLSLEDKKYYFNYN